VMMRLRLVDGFDLAHLYDRNESEDGRIVAIVVEHASAVGWLCRRRRDISGDEGLDYVEKAVQRVS